MHILVTTSTAALPLCLPRQQRSSLVQGLFCDPIPPPCTGPLHGARSVTPLPRWHYKEIAPSASALHKGAPSMQRPLRGYDCAASLSELAVPRCQWCIGAQSATAEGRAFLASRRQAHIQDRPSHHVRLHYSLGIGCKGKDSCQSLIASLSAREKRALAGRLHTLYENEAALSPYTLRQ